ncbi:TetR family transcriptional regulator [Burkholderia cepacia]|uniref:TetR family transcriptional regulator n=1 Tax=Burkholderia cepacia TaxID=292 RepID=UPI000CF104E2|nr:TetR family transcriptional regulator [Burkholderia cepacia]KAB1588203.1 TetR family transcriptional regulator [Burkholderia cepacia]MDN7444915.1 TetR family transcriptional regulator [Burkholderia cepacia]
MSTRAGTTPAEPQTESAPRRRSRVKTREELQLAVLRVKNKGLKLSISAVATEAGVSAGLIHNTYPDIAEEIRAQVGRGTRQQRDTKAAEVKKVRAQLTILRAERDAALADVARLASINETLRQEVAKLQAVTVGKVVVLIPP